MESASRTTLRRRHDELAVKMKLVKTAQKLMIDEFNVPAVDPLVDPTEPSQESSPLQRTGKVDVPQFSPSQALAGLVNANLTKSAYDTMASAARSIGNNLFPCYSLVNSYSCGITLEMNIES
ncbi:hypothetical protein QAD02_021785 [Eretmocerus hayati]|uniref:Uncharacterized protein n=1 Tax=Eretmocerus hayati TaxID=131215 RepID=A0ACC2PUE0_9HYME|nr:hypothetical protein QAD02_021785 [Eretmocerus hayati]